MSDTPIISTATNARMDEPAPITIDGVDPAS